MLSRQAVAANLDALAAAWAWTADDLLVHALPLFHVHGLVLGVLGPLRRGGTLHHLGTLDAAALAAAGATLVFGVPTQYHRLADQLEGDPESAAAIGRARLLVSGSAALTTVDHAAPAQAHRPGRPRALRHDRDADPHRGPRRRGTRARHRRTPAATARRCGSPCRRLIRGDDMGAIEIRSPSLFDGYLNRPDATAAAHTADGWFATGDIGRWTAVRCARDRRPQRHRPDQVRRLQDRRGGDRERAAGAPGRRGGGGRRGARRRPRGADRRLRRPGRGAAHRAGADRPRRRRCSPRTSGRGRSGSPTRCPATTWARS